MIAPSLRPRYVGTECTSPGTLFLVLLSGLCIRRVYGASRKEIASYRGKHRWKAFIVGESYFVTMYNKIPESFATLVHS